MTNPWQYPDHTNPIGHHVPNPTPQGQSGPLLGGGGDWSPAPQAGVPSSYPISTGAVVSGSSGPVRKIMWLAILLSVLLGPLGLFYVGFLHGVAALIVLPVIMRFLVNALLAAHMATRSTVESLIVPLLWCFTVPWAIVGVMLRNAKADRE